MTIKSGTRLGPYEIVGPIGAGGMGEVYRARDTRLDRQVAVKILPAAFAHDARLKVRFEREARTISQLSHPNICTLFDVGENYIVMELIEGESLADRIARGALPLPDVLKYGMQVAEALGKAHREGVVHRDLKPGNVMIAKSGAKLLDFGLAKTATLRAAVEDATAQKPLTAEGVVVGTFQYMAPEQLAGEEPDARTDIFALGALLYEMATGRRAFEGKTKTSLIGAIVSGEPIPIGELQPLTPPALEHVIKKCLAKDPEDRWQNSTDIAEELRWISQAGSQAGVAAPLMMRRRVRERVVTVALAAVLIGATYFVAHRTATPPINHRYTIPSTSAEYGEVGLTQVSPDGRHLLIFGSKDGVNRAWLRDVGSLQTRPIAGTEGASWLPQFSADGRFLYFFSDKFLNRVPVDGGTPDRLFARGGNEAWPSTNESGVVLFMRDRSIMKWSAGDTAPVALLHPDPAKGEVAFEYPQFLPDGKHFLVALTRRSKEGIESGAIVAASIDSNDRVNILNQPSRAMYAPPGYLLFGRSRKLVAVPFDARHLKVTGPESVVAENVNGSGTWTAFSVSNVGVLTYRLRTDELRLVWRAADGRELGSFSQPAAYGGGAISPDGRSIAISIGDAQSGRLAIWLLGLDRPTSSRITFEPADSDDPVWIDNRRLAYGYWISQSSTNEIRLRSIDDSSPDGETLVKGVACDPIAVTRRGSLLYTQRRPGESWEMWEVSVAPPHTARAVLRAPYSIFDGGPSRDGKWLLYASNESGRSELYVRRFEDGMQKTQVTTSGVNSGLWSIDGSSIIYPQGNDVYSIPIATDRGQPVIGQPKRLFGVPTLGNFLVAPDGRFLVWLPAQQENPPTVVMTNWLETLHKAQ